MDIITGRQHLKQFDGFVMRNMTFRGPKKEKEPYYKQWCLKHLFHMQDFGICDVWTLRVLVCK